MSGGDELIQYAIGKYQILLPPDHALPLYQTHARRYDKAIGEIAQAVQRKYPDLTAIDIGANIGDSLAILRTHAEMPVLCVEGNSEFLGLLQRNAAIVGGTVDVFPGFIGTQSRVTSVGISSVSGTARITEEDSGGSEAVEMLTLEELLHRYPRYADTRLIKIDTDGYDFRILVASEALLARLKPVVFYECDPCSHEDQYEESIDAFRSPLRAGYSKFAIFDTFGHLIQVQGPDVGAFERIIDYLLSNSLFGTVVYYLDVCAFSPADEDICDRYVADWHDTLLKARAARKQVSGG